jgi:RHH-type proline utilization regulon transcriptional repressor/proline dehydrogenase/delta 1-pyrroline-5-carboxylate dehydrogenase
VGSQLLQIGAQMQPGQHHIKRVIAEMGGKNALIIDRDADLDDAILGTLHSAFGFQGQKCSAASRVIVVGDIHDHFVERLTQAARSLSMGSPEAPGNFMGPVIDEQAYSNILQAIVNGKQAGELALFDEQRALADGYYIPPAIFTNVDPDSPLAQEEIFGPVLSVLKADDFDQAIQLANHSRYALTGGLYSRQPSHLEKARREFRVGNLYLNRRITGALVSRQPFGGFKMSGVGAKAGSDDYLLQFMDAACVTENTLRRGFAPKVDDE